MRSQRTILGTIVILEPNCRVVATLLDWHAQNHKVKQTSTTSEYWIESWIESNDLEEEADKAVAAAVATAQAAEL